MIKNELTKMSATQISDLIKRKDLSVLEVYTHFEDRKNKVDSYVNAFKNEKICVDEQIELIQAKINSNELTNPLAGLPIAIKDNISIKNANISCGSKMLEKYISPYDAHVIECINANGMYASGITNMDEFAMGSTSETCAYGVVRNPWDLNRSPGGSSGGSASALASRSALLALGSDTGGSVRQPASFCGVVGLKPTYGLVSRYGLIAFASSLDQIGPMANSVTDVAALLDVISKYDGRDSTCLKTDRKNYFSNLSENILKSKESSKPLQGKKIAILDKCYSLGSKSDQLDKLNEFSKFIESLGGICKPVKLPSLEYAVATYYIISSAQASSNLARFDGIKYTKAYNHSQDITELYEKTRSMYFGNETIRRIVLGTFVLSSGYFDEYYITASKVSKVIKDEVKEILNEYDAILCPSSMNSPPVIGESLKEPLKMYLNDLFTVVANLTGFPAISIPTGFDKDGLPVGVQLMGKPLDEDTLFYIGALYQNATDFHTVVPDISSNSRGCLK